jgi:hypothetical protein
LPGFDLPQSTQVDDVVTCSRCGRVLKNPVSRERGMGPTCAAKHEAAAYLEFVRMVDEGQMRLPGTEES